MAQNEIYPRVLRELTDVRKLLIQKLNVQIEGNTECCTSGVHIETNTVQYLHINVGSGSEYILSEFADRDGEKAKWKVLYLG